MLHAYCIRRAGEPGPPPELDGVGGAAVRLLEEGGLGAWLSEGAELQPTVRHLREHDRVVREALRTATPLPVRFGMRFRDEAAAREALRSGADAFVASLARVAGRVEMGVRVGWELEVERRRVERDLPPLPAGVPGSGRAFLEQRRAALRLEEGLRRRAGELLDRVERALADPDLPSARTLLLHPEVAGSVAHLVHRNRVHLYQRCFEKARASLPELAITLSGPWAPYSFVGDA